ncbi:RadC family protein [Burkholderia gladioli]|uniref:RadC family protein n=1 Tax=Burkholderia gladioli TaxID=28095 RepID=UPI000F53ED04|nr:DNA repair protein RadC [Burkholderia gladioli]
MPSNPSGACHDAPELPESPCAPAARAAEAAPALAVVAPAAGRPVATPAGSAGAPRKRKKRLDKEACKNLPRERLLQRGADAVTDVELVALLIGNGIGFGRSGDTALRVFKKFGSLRALLDASHQEIQAVEGIAEARAAVLIATTELVRRALVERARARSQVDSPGAVRDYLRLKIGTRQRETFLCLYLDAQHRLLELEESTIGSLTRMAVYPREIVRRALESGAAALIVAHNHPSGVVRPSAEDRRLTQLLRDALALVDVRLTDHIVVGESETFSFAQAGLL